MSAADAIRDKLRSYPQLRFEESADCITVPTATPDGFPVSLQQHGSHYTVSFAAWHEEFDSELEALNCFAFGLSEECRLRVESRGSFDYRWTVQHYRDGGWHDDSQTGLI